MKISESVSKFEDCLRFERRLSPHTLISYSNTLARFIAYLGEAHQLGDVEEVSHLVIRSWIVRLMEQKNSPRTVNHKIAVLKTFYKFLLRQQLVKDNPMLRIKAPKMSKRLTAFVAKEGMDQLLDNVEFGDDFEGIRNQLIIELFYATGIRLSELTGLLSANVDRAAGNIKVLGKRNKERLIPFSAALKPKIENYLALRSELRQAESPFFFLTKTGNKLYEKLVYRLINNYLSLVTSIKKKSPHVLRHTFATHMLNNGADINAIKELLGHSSLSATQIYTHNSVEKLKNIHKQAHPKA